MGSSLNFEKKRKREEVLKERLTQVVAQRKCCGNIIPKGMSSTRACGVGSSLRTEQNYVCERCEKKFTVHTFSSTFENPPVDIRLVGPWNKDPQQIYPDKFERDFFTVDDLNTHLIKNDNIRMISFVVGTRGLFEYIQ